MSIHTVELGREFEKYQLLSRWRQEKELGQSLITIASDFKPDIVISANAPLRAQNALATLCNQNGSKFIFWSQEVLGVGIQKMLRTRLPIIGGLIGKGFELYEQSILKKSHHAVLITDAFIPYMPSRLINEQKVSVIPNWAVLEELPVVPKLNQWSRAHELDDCLCLMYTGTLGMKHNPQLLLDLAVQLRGRKNVKIVVISEGSGAEFLRERKLNLVLNNLIIENFLSFEELPNALGTADILLGILEPVASIFAVPSKVMTYLCAGKPLLLAIPEENLAARIVRESNSGVVVSPSLPDAFLQAAVHLLENPALRSTLGDNARYFAEKTFNIKAIGDRFERIFEKVVQ